MRPVVFDIDGVLAYFYEGYWRVCAELGIPKPVIGKWDDFWNPKVWNRIKDSDSFWVNLPALATREEFKRIKSLRDTREVYFATSRPGRYSHIQTIEWLVQHGISYPTVVLTSMKGDFCQSVDAEFFLDDKAGNCVYVQYHTNNRTAAYLLDAPYNQFDRDVLGSKVKRVTSVSSFLDIVEA